MSRSTVHQRLNIELVAAETGSYVAVQLCIWVPESKHFVLRDVGAQAQPEDHKYFKSAVLFIVLLSALCSGWHTLHPEIVGYYQAVNLEAVHVPNNFACLIQFKICTAVIYQSLDLQSYPFLYSSIFISQCYVRLRI